MSTQQISTQRIHDPDVNIPEQINDFRREILSLMSKCSLSVDAPRNPDGEWFIDIACDKFLLNVAWRVKRGFGLFTAEAGYGDQPNEVYKKSRTAALRVAQLLEEWQDTHRLRPTSLAQIRQLTGTAQSQLAAALSLNQPAISRFEKRNDVKLSTLNAYLEAMGGRLEMRAHFDDLDVSIALPSLEAEDEIA